VLIQDDFEKNGVNFIAEVVPNFWGTNFEVYDYGYEKSLYDRTPNAINKLGWKRVSVC
jgi:hypothetical protein